MSKFYCNTCNYGTDNKSNFNKHNKIPTHLKLIAGESTTKTYKCDVEGCEYSTKDSSNFKGHKNNHQGRKKYITHCLACSVHISDSNHLKHHYCAFSHKNNVLKN